MSTRPERDSFGLIDVPAQRLWGAQTQRSLHFFSVSTETMPRELLVALVQVKQAAARANAQLGVLDAHKADAIDRAAAEVLANRHDSEFPLSVWQTGSGTQTNMNVNEVLANRASELLGGPRGEGRLVHPNDDVNRSQSSNDVFPTAMHVAAVVALEHSVLPALQRLTAAWQAQRQRWSSLVKLGRTHLQDATPLTVGQEFSGYVAQLEHARPPPRGGPAAPARARPGRHRGRHRAQRAKGLRGPRHRRIEHAHRARLRAGCQPLRGAGHDGRPGARAWGAQRAWRSPCSRWPATCGLLASGPRAGLGELRLPENEPGSSIMPGKVNPTQAEMVTMVGAQVLGNDVTVGFAGASGQLELNVFRPVVAHAFLQSARLLAGAMHSFCAHCVEGLEPDVAVFKRAGRAFADAGDRADAAPRVTTPPRASPSAPTPRAPRSKPRRSRSGC
jgi:fumarate hydratase class II